MANRHANKRLRRAILARKARTGESYQRALAAVLAARPRIAEPGTAAPTAEPASRKVHAELIETTVAGRPTVLTLLHDVASDRVFLLQPHSLRGIRWRGCGSA